MMKVDIEEIADRMYLTKAHIPGEPAVFSIYLIKENGGALIEPGPAALIPMIRDAMAQIGLRGLEYIVPTHIHMDHAGGAGQLSRCFPEARVVVHPQGAGHFIEPAKLIQGTQRAYGEDFESVYGPIVAIPESRVKIANDGDILPLGSRDLKIILTPGHTANHIAIFDTHAKGIFCGEALGVMMPEAEFQLLPAAVPGFDQTVYIQSMERLRRLKPCKLFYSHDGVGNQPDELISRAIQNTELVGDAVLNALKTEKTDDAVRRSVGEYIRKHLGIKLEDFYLNMTVLGYAVYYKKKGLI